MVKGVLTIPLSGIRFGSSRDRDTRVVRLGEFVAGAENALAAVALKPLLDSPSGGLSPIVLYGPHGSGKSHLACGLADWWRRRFPTAPVQCLSGAEFARDLAAALEARRLEAWRDDVREAGLFALDDVGELRGKPQAQQELLHVLDALADEGAAIVITARTFPGHWPALMPALRSRLTGGLAVSLALPALETRRMIFERLAAARGLALTAETLDGLATGLQGSVPTLVSALLELELTGSLQDGTVGPKRVRQIVSDRAGARQPALRQVANLTAKYFGLKLADLKSPARRRTLVASRGVAMYLARQLTTNSLDQIGKYFGGRDHTTVLYGCRRTEKLLRRDRATRQAVAELKKLLLLHD